MEQTTLTLIVAIAGPLVGFGASFVTQLVTHRQARKARKEDAEESRRARLRQAEVEAANTLLEWLFETSRGITPPPPKVSACVERVLHPYARSWFQFTLYVFTDFGHRAESMNEPVTIERVRLVRDLGLSLRDMAGLVLRESKIKQDLERESDMRTAIARIQPNKLRDEMLAQFDFLFPTTASTMAAAARLTSGRPPAVRVEDKAQQEEASQEEASALDADTKVRSAT